MRARFPSPLTEHAHTASPDEIRCGRSDGGEESQASRTEPSRAASLFYNETTDSELALNMSDIVRCQSPQVRIFSLLKRRLASLSDNAGYTIKKKIIKKEPPTIYHGGQVSYLLTGGLDLVNEENAGK